MTPLNDNTRERTLDALRMRTKTRLAALATSMFFATCSAFAAPPTIGGATIGGTPASIIRILEVDRIALIGSFAIHGADAMTWTEYSFWMGSYNSTFSNAAITVLQSIYDRPASRANFPSFFLNREIVIGLLQNLADTAPSVPVIDFWEARLNTYSNDPNLTLRALAKGRLIYDIYNGIVSQGGNDPIAVRLNNRLTAAVVVKKETDTVTERDDRLVSNATIYNVSRPRLQAITDVATRDAALAPLERLTWVIDQSAIPVSATYDGESGLLTVSGTELLALAGADNDIDPTKLTLYGDDTPYTLTSAPVELTSATSFQIRLNAPDRIALRTRLNRDGAGSAGNTKYLLAGSPGWCAALNASQGQALLTGARMNVVNNAPAILNIDRSDAATTYDAATDGVLLMRYLLGYRGAELIANARGNGGGLRDTTQIENYLADSLALLDVDGDGQILASTDGVMILRRLLNPTASISNAAAMSAITANAKRGTRTDAEIVSAIDALKP